MEEDISSFAMFRSAEFLRGNDGNVSTALVDGLDNVEIVYWNIPWRSRLSVFDNTGPDLAGKAILRECLQVAQAWCCYHVSLICLIPCLANKSGTFWLFSVPHLPLSTRSLRCSSPCSLLILITTLKHSSTRRLCSSLSSRSDDISKI